MHPLIGTWIANVEKSTRHENHKFASATMHFAVDDCDVRIRYDGVNASGRSETSEQVLTADGQSHDHPLVPGIVVTTSLSPRGLDSSARRDGATIGHGSYQVSEDGTTMTATVAGVDGSGKPFEQVIVFDRGA